MNDFITITSNGDEILINPTHIASLWRDVGGNLYIAMVTGRWIVTEEEADRVLKAIGVKFKIPKEKE